MLRTCYHCRRAIGMRQDSIVSGDMYFHTVCFPEWVKWIFRQKETP